MLRKICIGLLLPVILSIAGFFYVRTRPIGNIRLVEGVNNPISIERDEFGVPTVHAQDMFDATYGIGYAMAQDRLWQLDMNRRFATGRLSEIIGTKGFELDKFVRNVKILAKSKNDMERISAECLKIVKAFAAGINAGAQNQWKPIEYYLTGSNWEPFLESDSIAVEYITSLSLGNTWGNDILRGELEKLIGEATDFLLPTEMNIIRPLAYAVTGDELAENLHGEPENLKKASFNGSFKFDESFKDFGPGSNGWVISGKHTKSGKPILAFDPHLSFSAPSVWYLASLKLPNDTLTGSFLLAQPSMSLGKNKNFAWGPTSLKTDDIDIFAEKIEGDKYLYGDSYIPLSYFEETIHIKGEESKIIKFKETLHGPILENTAVGGKTFSGPLPRFTQNNFAFAWNVYNFTDELPLFTISVWRAKTIEDVKQTLKKVTCTRMAYMIASEMGDIYFQSTGRVPIRSVQGNWIIPGWIPENSWKGFISYEEMPYVINPEKGFIVTANSFSIDSSYKYFESFGRYFSPGRAERIHELIEEKIKAGVKFTAKDQIEIQKDELDIFAREGVPILLHHLKNVEKYSEEVELMKKWDFVMRKEIRVSAIYAAWARQIAKNLLINKVPDDILNSYMKSLLMQLGFLRLFDSVPSPIEKLCDDPQTSNIESCSDLISKSFIEACEITKNKVWGDLHNARLSHFPFSQVPFLKPFFERKQSVGGTYSTIHCTHFDWSQENFDAIMGVGLRFVTDFGDKNENYIIMQTGMGGSPLHPHYDDMFENHHYGEPRRFRYDS